VHLLPFFIVRWSQANIHIEISGVTGKIVNYENYGAPATIPLPTNYYVMLRISPDHTTWGQQFGYNPLNTETFQSFAASFVTDQMNRLIEVWHLPSRKLATNDITWFLAKPQTNSFDVIARFNERFQLQIIQSRIEILLDEDRNLKSYSEDPNRLRDALKQTNVISPATAEASARNALDSLGLNSKSLGVKEPPVVKRQITEFEGKSIELPIYEVSWWPDKENTIPGNQYPLVAFHVSATSGTIISYGNTSLRTPPIPLPTNYATSIQIRPSPLVVPDIRSAKP
jgi:hypothetical protein